MKVPIQLNVIFSVLCFMVSIWFIWMADLSYDAGMNVIAMISIGQAVFMLWLTYQAIMEGVQRWKSYH